MTIKQALEYAKHELKHYKQVERDGIRMVDHIEFYEIVVDALEKQEPKKARKEQRTNGFSNLQFYYVCPVCGVALNDSPYTYCEKCGQKIRKCGLE